MKHLHLFSIAALTAVAILTMSSQQAQAKGSVPCKDGTMSAMSGRGACSGHGGVDKAAMKAAKAAGKMAAKKTMAPAAAIPAAKKATKKAAKETAVKSSAKSSAKLSAMGADASGATAKCKDGTYSHAKHHRGSCSRHGGVAQFMTN